MAMSTEERAAFEELKFEFATVSEAVRVTERKLAAFDSVVSEEPVKPKRGKRKPAVKAY
ncbi:MAG: hypothetical protein K8U57_23070 [Planctomycetes bacterium]|nr:hypothetical protein [Planctomycetota bacterium]